MLFCGRLGYISHDATLKVYMNCVWQLTAHWKLLSVDGAEKTSVIIPNLDADEEYCVKMKSVSFVGDSHFTSPLKRRVFRTGSYVRVYFV